MALDEIDQLLREMDQGFNAAMSADAPAAIREKVQSTLPDWMRWCGIDECHRRRLEGEVCQLVTDCLKAVCTPVGPDEG